MEYSQAEMTNDIERVKKFGIEPVNEIYEMIPDTLTAQRLHLQRLHCKQIQSHIRECIERLCLLNNEHKKEMFSLTESGASRLEVATLLFTHVSELMEGRFTRSHERACIRNQHEIEIKALNMLHYQAVYALGARQKSKRKSGTV